jgi:hypothetical protein
MKTTVRPLESIATFEHVDIGAMLQAEVTFPLADFHTSTELVPVPAPMKAITLPSDEMSILRV